jgi:hypothetical protein
VPRASETKRTRVWPFFSALVEDDPEGALWLPALLGAAPRAAEVLGELADEPGALVRALTRDRGTGLIGLFDFPVPPPRAILHWYVDHPEVLRRAGGRMAADARLRRDALLDDTSPGRAEAQREAHAALDEDDPRELVRWCRFEGPTILDAALVTDRLVVAVLGRRSEPLGAGTGWYPPRSQLVCALEAAALVAGDGRRSAALVLSDALLPDATPEALAATLPAAAPHLDGAARDALAGGYLGNLTWAEAGAATGVVL